MILISKKETPSLFFVLCSSLSPLLTLARAPSSIFRPAPPVSQCLPPLLLFLSLFFSCFLSSSPRVLSGRTYRRRTTTLLPPPPPPPPSLSPLSPLSPSCPLSLCHSVALSLSPYLQFSRSLPPSPSPSPSPSLLLSPSRSPEACSTVPPAGRAPGSASLSRWLVLLSFPPSFPSPARASCSAIFSG